MKTIFSQLSTAVEISSTAVKIAQVDLSGGKAVLRKVASYRLPDQSQETVTETLKKVRNDLGISRAVTVVQGREVNVKNYLFPEMEKNELKKAISWKIGESLPLPVTSYIMNIASPTEVSVSAGGKKKLVVVQAVKKEFLDSISNMFQQSRITLDFIESQGKALYNLARYNGQIQSTGLTGFLDIGAVTTNLCVFENGSAKYARDFQYGVTKETDLKDFIQKVCHQIEESVNYYQRMFGISGIDRLLITGGPSAESLILEGISQAFSFPVEQLETVRKVENQTEHDENTISSYSVAIGTCLTEKKQALFIPSGFSARIVRLSREHWQLSAAAALLFFITGHFIYGMSRGFYLEYRNNKLQKSISVLQPEFSRVEQQNEELKNLRIQIEKYSALQRKGLNWGKLLLFLSNFMPDDMKIDSLIQQGEEQVVFSGKSMQFRQATEFAEILSKSGFFESGKLTDSRIDPSGTVSFQINARIR